MLRDFEFSQTRNGFLTPTAIKIGFGEFDVNYNNWPKQKSHYLIKE